MNGSVGIVRKIVYKNSLGPRDDSKPLPAYVIVEFKNVDILQEHKAFPNYPSNWIPIPVVTDHCEKKCCSMTTIPLRVCNALTIHKSQGMTIGPGENFERAIVYLPDKSMKQKTTPGLELVAFSRVTSPEYLAIGNISTSLPISQLKKIGQNPTNEKIKSFHKYLDDRSENSCNIVRNKIKSLDNSRHGNEEGTFEGGCRFLLSWYNNLHQN